MHLLKSYWASLLWAIVILLLSTLSIHGPENVSLIKIPHFDKIVHFGMYFIWTSIILAERNRHQKDIERKAIVLLIIGISLYGISMEILQWLGKAGRQADLFDAFANSLGSIISIILYQRTKWLPKILSLIFENKEREIN